MASYHFHISSVGRSAGRRATASAAYRAGERLRDERSGRLYDFSRRKDVAHTEIFLPPHLGGAANAWALEREKLWNTAERAEKRSDSLVAREYQLALPHELTIAQQVALAQAFSRELTERYRVAVDLAVHLPRPEGDPRNFHAHLLTTTREVTPKGLGAKAGLDLRHAERRRRELPDVRQEFRTLRERWATLTNEALREANLDARVDHRSFAERGIDRDPRPYIPIASLKMEQRGVRSEVAERIREAYRLRVQARLEHAEQADSARAAPGTANAPNAAKQVGDLDEIRRQAREAWLRLRPQEAQKTDQQRHADRERDATPGREATADRPGRDDDLAL